MSKEGLPQQRQYPAVTLQQLVHVCRQSRNLHKHRLQYPTAILMPCTKSRVNVTLPWRVVAFHGRRWGQVDQLDHSTAALVDDHGVFDSCYIRRGQRAAMSTGVGVSQA